MTSVGLRDDHCHHEIAIAGRTVAIKALVALSALVPLACAADETASDSVSTEVTASSVSITTVTTPKEMTIGGIVTGLFGLSLQLSNTGSYTLAITANGAFVFPTRLSSGSLYAVTIVAQPSSQTCVVTNGFGTVATSDVTTVSVTCKTKPPLAIGGTVTGLSGSGLQLSNNGSDTLAITANGTFTFPTRLNSGITYHVAIVAQPSSQTCVVTNGLGTVAISDVTTVAVTCKTKPPLSIGGAVTGLSGPGLQLSNNGTDTLAITADGTFVFPTRLSSGSTFNVTVVAQPDSQQICVVTNGSGTVGGSNVTSVVVICAI